MGVLTQKSNRTRRGCDFCGSRFHKEDQCTYEKLPEMAEVVDASKEQIAIISQTLWDLKGRCPPCCIFISELYTFTFLRAGPVAWTQQASQ